MASSDHPYPLSALTPWLLSPCGAACRGLHRAGGASRHPRGPGHYVLCQSPADPDTLHCRSPSCKKQGTHVLGEGPGGTQVGGRADAEVLTNFPRSDSERGPQGEELGEGEAGPRTYSRLVTEVSATEFRLGIEGRVSPVEDKTWPPWRDQDKGQRTIKIECVRGQFY